MGIDKNMKISASSGADIRRKKAVIRFPVIAATAPLFADLYNETVLIAPDYRAALLFRSPSQEELCKNDPVPLRLGTL